MTIGLVLLLLTPSAARAQSDFTHVLDVPYTPNNCSAEPAYDRVFRIQRVTWKGHEYLFVDEGNDIHVFNIDNPLSPVSGYSSYFGIAPVGDYDYNLINFSVCDDCRWGIGIHKSGTILFDLGTGDTPNFGSHAYYGDVFVEGGFTFSHGGQQYLVAADFGPNPCPMNTSGLYEFNSIDEADNLLLHCLDNGAAGPQIANGLVVPDNPTPTLYLSEIFGQFRIYSMQTTPTFSLQYEGTGGIERARMNRTNGAAVDIAAGLLAVAEQAMPATVDLYDIGWETGSPTNPVLLHREDLPSAQDVNAVGLRYPILWAGRTNTPTPPLTFDVSDPTTYLPLDQSFWDESHPWNSLSACLWNEMAAFSGDGSVMYLSRYAALQVIDVSGILPPQCGNGLVEVLEDCDDGNTTDGDGCSAICAVENGWTCSGEPSVCTTPTSCGDGLLQTPESCDDGNTTDGDGCSAHCQVEPGWTCVGQPSVCAEPGPSSDGSSDGDSGGCGCVQQGNGRPNLGIVVFGLLVWRLRSRPPRCRARSSRTGPRA